MKLVTFSAAGRTQHGVFDEAEDTIAVLGDGDLSAVVAAGNAPATAHSHGGTYFPGAGEPARATALPGQAHLRGGELSGARDRVRF